MHGWSCIAYATYMYTVQLLKLELKRWLKVRVGKPNGTETRTDEALPHAHALMSIFTPSLSG